MCGLAFPAVSSRTCGGGADRPPGSVAAFHASPAGLWTYSSVWPPGRSLGSAQYGSLLPALASPRLTM